MTPRFSWLIASIVLPVLLLPLVSSPAPAADEPIPDLAQRPYRIRVWISVDPASRLGPRSTRALVDDWLLLSHRFVGEPWAVEVIDGPGPLRGRPPAQLAPEHVRDAVEGVDKGWFLHVEPAGAGGGFDLSGREYDATTQQLGPLYRQPAPYPRDSARSLFELTRRLFAPIAEIERTDSGARLLVQGAALPAADRAGQIVSPGTVFRPYWMFLAADRSVQEVRSIPFTYLHVESVSEAMASCEVVSGLRRPLPRQVAGRYRLVALGLRPADVPTRFRFLAGDGETRRPAAGYVLTARGLGDQVVTEVGTTDREGRIALPPQFSNSLVILRLLAGGVEPLREFPVLPGETLEEREIPVEPRPEAVALEYRLKALQDEIVDLIARRGRLEALLDARSAGGAWDEVKRLLDEYQQLTPRSALEARLDQLAEQAEQEQAERQVPILTRTAQAHLAETRALIDRYLDDEAYNAYLEAYQRSQQPDASASTPASPIVRAPVRAPASAPGSN